MVAVVVGKRDAQHNTTAANSVAYGVGEVLSIRNDAVHHRISDIVY